MGERKGQNLYYPPDYDPRVGGLNRFLGTHALRERARKLHMGILIIRFEMPYNIWCDGCNNHIGMGVRYNAEKTKVGMYYSTPIYQFRMKCHLCDNHFEIKTDPGNLDYVIVSGARRQENRWDPKENGQIVPETKETQKRMFDDAMFRLEHKTGDVDIAKLDKPRLGRLQGRNESVWKDDYEANCSLRRNFRKRRKELEEAQVNDNLLMARSSLDITLLPESEDDRNMASLLALRPSTSIEEKQKDTRSKILNSPSLPSSSGISTGFIGLKTTKSVHLTRNALGVMIKKAKVDTETTMKEEENSTQNKIKSDEKAMEEAKKGNVDIEKTTKEESEKEEKNSTEDKIKSVEKVMIKKGNVDIEKTTKEESSTEYKIKSDENNIKNDKDENVNCDINGDKTNALVSLVGDYSFSSSDEISD